MCAETKKKKPRREMGRSDEGGELRFKDAHLRNIRGLSCKIGETIGMYLTVDCIGGGLGGEFRGHRH